MLSTGCCYYEQALAIQEEIGDRRGKGYQPGNLGLAYAHLGQVEKAREYLKATLAIAAEIKDPGMEAIALRTLEKLK